MKTTPLLKFKALLFLAISAIVSITGCKTENKEEKIKAGSICTIEDGEGKYGIVKVLVISDLEAHVKIYKNKYNHRPDSVDISTLSLGTIKDTDGFGVGHVPLQREGFNNWKPIPVAFEPVSKEELEGYEIWKNQ